MIGAQTVTRRAGQPERMIKTFVTLDDLVGLINPDGRANVLGSIAVEGF